MNIMYFEQTNSVWVCVCVCLYAALYPQGESCGGARVINNFHLGLQYKFPQCFLTTNVYGMVRIFQESTFSQDENKFFFFAKID